MKSINANLIWHHRSEKMPSKNKRILVFSPMYNEDDPFRVRIMDSQFYKISTDAEWWAYVNLPKQLNTKKTL